MYVDVDVQNPGMIFQQFQNGNNNIVYVTETGRLELLGMMQAAGPVNGDVATVLVQFHRAVQRGARVHGTKIVQAFEHRAILAHVKVIQVLAVRGQVLRRDPLQELNVLVVMEPAHVMSAGAVRPIDFHLVVKPVVQHQTVYDRQTVRFHRMRRPVMEVAHVRVIEVEHAFIGHCVVDTAVKRTLPEHALDRSTR